MKTIKTLFGVIFAFAAVVLFAYLVVYGSHYAFADFRDGAGQGKFVESTVTSDSANEQGSGVHTPIVASVPSVAAAVTTSYFTSSTSAIAFDTVSLISTKFDLYAVRVTYSAAKSTQSLTISLDSGAGSEFDAKFLVSAVTTTSDVFRPDKNITFQASDSAKVTYPNADGDTVAVEFIVIEP